MSEPPTRSRFESSREAVSTKENTMQSITPEQYEHRRAWAAAYLEHYQELYELGVPDQILARRSCQRSRIGTTSRRWRPRADVTVSTACP